MADAGTCGYGPTITVCDPDNLRPVRRAPFGLRRCRTFSAVAWAALLASAAPASGAVRLTPASGEPGARATLTVAQVAPASRVELRVAAGPVRLLRADNHGVARHTVRLPQTAGESVRIAVRDGRGRHAVLRYLVRSRWAGKRWASVADWRGRMLRVGVDLRLGRLITTARLRGTSAGVPLSARLGGERVAAARAGARGKTVLRMALPPDAAGRWLRVGRQGERLAVELPTPPAVVAVTGDIACPPGEEVEPKRCRHAAAARLVARLRPDAVALAGDVQNPSGKRSHFMGAFHRSWGRLRMPLRPVPGNHDYRTPGAAGFFDYFEFQSGWRPPPWYAYDLGPWRLIALNSNCEPGRVDCTPASEQVRWLRATLAAEPRRCTLAYWHHPRYSSGFHGSDERTDVFWQALDEAGAEVVVSGHDHHYERFAPQDDNGQLDGSGVRQFVAGLGGHYPSILRSPRAPHSEWGQNRALGVLLFRLYDDVYSWRFVSLGGRVLDSGNGSCV